MELQTKLAIVGGRTFTDYVAFEKIVDAHIQKIGIPILIISGGAQGVDTLTERYATEHDIPIKEFKPDWEKYGRAADPIRNTDIIKESTHVLALPTKESVGTHDSINKDRKMNKKLLVVNV